MKRQNLYPANICTSFNQHPFGMLMPERSFSSGDYRYGFNSQEKDDEVAGSGNVNTAEYWEYDCRLGRRWNLDPKPSSRISEYSAFGDNPIWLSDLFGDTLDIGANLKSQEDIKSLVLKENEKHLVIKDNNVSLDFGSLDSKAKADLLNKDAGLKLLNDLASSSKKYLYEASDYALLKDEAGAKSGYQMFKRSHLLINASNGGKDSNGGHSDRPKDGYDGQVVIHPDASFDEEENGYIYSKSRASIVFHELGENYERTNNGIDYQDSNGKSGAHTLSILREKAWTGASRKPGEVYSKPSGNKVRPTPQRLYEIQKIISNYMFSS